MAQNRHNMALFCHFQAFLATPLAVRTTFMVTLGIGRTQTLVTHVGRWCGAIFALSGYLYGAGVVQNKASTPTGQLLCSFTEAIRIASPF